MTRQEKMKWTCTSTDESIIMLQTETESRLKINFERTIRVPDNAQTSELPPGLGHFPLFKIQDYERRLPDAVASKGGVFFPMYQREAMWISFEATAPFMVKIYAGGVNAISGEHYAEDQATKLRRLELNSRNESIQDYVVARSQPWLDGFAVSPGVVRQFVAMPLGAGYTVEGQLTGREAVGGLQIEVTPVDVPKWQQHLKERAERATLPRDLPPIKLAEYEGFRMPHITKDFHVLVKDLTGQGYDIPCSAESTVDQIKSAISLTGKTLAGHNIKNNDTIHLILRLRGGGGGPERMGFAAGGEIKQTIHKDRVAWDLWDSDATIAIRAHVFNTQDFQQVTGSAPPPCPVTAANYAAAGFPFFELDEEDSRISGQFDMLKSVNEMDQERGLAPGPEAIVEPTIIKLDKKGDKHSAETQHTARVYNPDGVINPAGPLRKFRCLRDLKQELRDLDE